MVYFSFVGLFLQKIPVLGKAFNFLEKQLGMEVLHCDQLIYSACVKIQIAQTASSWLVSWRHGAMLGGLQTIL